MTKYPWQANYPTDIPHEIDADTFPSLVDMLDSIFTEYAKRDAYENMGTKYTYAEIDEKSENFAAYLTGVLGFEVGDRIAIMLPNVVQFPIALFGAIRAGITVVNTNPLYTPSEMKHQFNDSGARGVVILENFASNLEEIIEETGIEHVIVTKLGDMVSGIKGMIVNLVVKHVKKMVPAYNLPKSTSFKQALAVGSKASYTRPSIGSESNAFLQYTGGTTGVSKGAMLTHRNIIANVEQVFAWMKPANLEYGKETFITALPLYHIFALTCNAFVCAKIGAKSVLITNPRDMPGFVKELGNHDYSLITGVNTLFNGLLSTPGFDEVDHSHTKLAMAGGMALQRFVAEKWQEKTGHIIAEGYGLTETSPVLCINPFDGRVQIGSIGMPLPSTDIIMLDDDGNEVPFGEPGELCAKGPQIMKGYWQRPEATVECFEGEYFKTGDIAVQQEDGFIRIVDRKKEMILVSGFNVYPNEVENCIASMEKVLEVGAIAVPDKKSTEAVKVFVVKADDSLTKEEVLEHCKEKLTGYKTPKYIDFIDELPKSNVGKVLRRILKEEDLKVNSYV
ncbi:MAG: AMP-binding protein [Cytophagales bacterium]|nr:AMP-binding protein [Cytophagales bacterium]